MPEPGGYGFAAFEDTNGYLVYQPGESALRVDENQLATCKAGEAKQDISLIIPKGGKLRLEGELAGLVQPRKRQDRALATLRFHV